MDVPRTGKALILATKPFELEDLRRSWFEVLSTLVVYGVAIAVILATPPAIGFAVAVFAGFVQFRMFSLYHDHVHGSLLAGSKLGRGVMTFIGLLILTPRNVWAQTHGFHHANNGKIEWTSVGSFRVLTTEQYEAATTWQRRAYLAIRHPIALLCGYFVVGIRGMCIQGFLRTPRRNWGGPVMLVLHFAVLGMLAWWLGPVNALLVWVVPVFVDHALASILFYVQHNFPETTFYQKGSWDHTEAALHGSSYLEMNAAMRWLTANIGYHHVHHLNARIPSYRLPEAMAAIPELQSPHRISFRARDMMACLRLRTWDAQNRRMQSEAAATGEQH